MHNTPRKKAAKKKVARKKAAAKKAVAKRHPLMLDGQSWDREAVMRIVCTQIMTTSVSVKKILEGGWEGNTLPTYAAFALWIADDKALFDQYMRAREIRALHMADEAIDLVDEAPHAYMDGYGQLHTDSGHVAWMRLRADERRWHASKLNRGIYGNQREAAEQESGDQTLVALKEEILRRINTGRSEISPVIEGEFEEVAG